MRKYLYNKMKDKYDKDKYFRYIKLGKMEAVYCCIESGIDPEY